MISPAWLFSLASIIAVFGILLAFKKMVASIQYKLENNQLTSETIQKEQSRYFLKVAIIEAVPILLIIIGFMQIGSEEVSTISTTIAALIIIGLIILTVVHVFLARNELLRVTSNEHKAYIHTLLFLGFGTILAIPIISLIALYI
ncbi:hypothetical protein NC661_17525 [Aquibacillus koreensis]|uniref:Uncharacterized protein n=2 Tax=Aquibacillus koreensis TaxID=279446 RepID=A0A9X3WPZ5_9BACI|nr:hypothetical protein [Aquibacillus koreensis]MCT2534955.1 hypothetical protein [Aquibacillus koreensis]MDC3422151.1 hypothetical protein [Aquibacillus koreensis]